MTAHKAGLLVSIVLAGCTSASDDGTSGVTGDDVITTGDAPLSGGEVATADGTGPKDGVTAGDDTSEPGEVSEISSCADEPCGEHGVCTDAAEGFTCACTDAYSGETCDVCDGRLGCGAPYVLMSGVLEPDGDGRGWFAMPLDGSPADIYRILPPNPPSGGVGFVRVSEMGGHLVYTTRSSADVPYEVWVASVRDATTTRVSPPAEPGTSVGIVAQMTAGTQRVVYVVARNGSSRNELVSVPNAGGTLTQLSKPLGAEDQVTGYFVSRDGRRVVYYADHDLTGVGEAYGVPTDGSAPPVKLNAPLLATGELGSATAMTSDGEYFVFTSTADKGTAMYDLYAAKTDGSVPAHKLNPAEAGSGTVTPYRLVITPDQRDVVFRANLRGSRAELFRVAIDGSTEPTPLAPDLPATASISQNFIVTADGTRVIAVGSLASTSDNLDVLSMPIEGGGPVVLTTATFDGRTVRGELVSSSDGKWVAWLQDGTAYKGQEIWAAPADGSAPARRACDPIPNSGDVATGFDFVGGTHKLVYLSNARVKLVELWAFNLDDASAVPVRLSPDLPAGGAVANFDTVPGASVVFFAASVVAGRSEVFRAPLDGSTPAVRVHEPLTEGQFLGLSWVGYVP